MERFVLEKYSLELEVSTESELISVSLYKPLHSLEVLASMAHQLPDAFGAQFPNSLRICAGARGRSVGRKSDGRDITHIVRGSIYCGNCGSMS
jgi:hypothetical protein